MPGTRHGAGCGPGSERGKDGRKAEELTAFPKAIMRLSADQMKEICAADDAGEVAAAPDGFRKRRKRALRKRPAANEGGGKRPKHGDKRGQFEHGGNSGVVLPWCLHCVLGVARWRVESPAPHRISIARSIYYQISVF
jgi:hypothetical protein